MEDAEGVQVAPLQDPGKARPFQVREPGVHPVGGGTGQVDLLVRHVEVPAEDHPLVLRKLREKPQEGAVPARPVVQARESPLRVRGIDVDQAEIRELHRDEAALPVLHEPQGGIRGPRKAHAQDRRQSFHPGEHGGPGIALFSGGVDDPVPMVRQGLLRDPQDVLRFRTDLLQAQDVRVFAAECFQSALAVRGADSIHVPG